MRTDTTLTNGALVTDITSNNSASVANRTARKLSLLLPHLLFLILAVAVGLSATWIPLQTDSAYTFFRLLQQPNFNLDDLRSVNFLTWGAMRIGVHYSLSPKTLALIFALSPVVYAYLIFLLSRYVFRLRQAEKWAVALVLLCAPFWFNPYIGLMNGLGYAALIYALWEGDYGTGARYTPWGIRFKLRAFSTVLLVLCVLSHPIWLLVLAIWLSGVLHFGLRDEDTRHKASRLERLVFLAIGLIFALLDFFFLPSALSFNLEYFLPTYGFNHAFSFWAQMSPYFNLFLWAGWAYLLFRCLCDKRYTAAAFLGSLTLVFVAGFGFKSGFETDFFARFLPFWILVTVLILREKRVWLWLIPGVLFFVCAGGQTLRNLSQRADFYQTLSEHLPEKTDKFLAYHVCFPENTFQPSAVPQTEMLNYTLLHTTQPRVVLFSLPHTPLRTIYDADLMFEPISGVEWPYNQMNPAYFESLYTQWNIDILPKDFLDYRPVYSLYCDIESFDYNRAGQAFFVCQTWPDSTVGLTSGPGFVERRCTETAFSGEACIKLAGEAWDALPITLNVKEEDSLLIGIKRHKGCAHLMVENFDFYRGKLHAQPFKVVVDTPIYTLPATTDTAANALSDKAVVDSSSLWQMLEIRTQIPHGIKRVTIHVATNIPRDTSYFDDLEILLKRRMF